MPGIFISHRREDSQMAAGRLSDGLRPRFGRDRVFLDIDTIQAGENWAERIRQAVEFSQVLLVLIGPHWLTIKTDGGGRRLEDPKDYVRLEVEHGLAQNHVRVIPVLLEGASIPRPQDLPLSMAGLCDLQAFRLAHANWEQDLNRLKKSLEETLEPTDPTKQWASRVAGSSDRLAHQARVQAENLRRNSRNFYAPGIDVSEVANHLVTYYQGQRMDVQLFPVPDGWQIQARHRGALRAATGLLSAMDVLLLRDDDELVIHISSGKWGDKVVVGTVGLWVAPLFFTSAYGAWRQTRFPDRTFKEVANFLARRIQR